MLSTLRAPQPNEQNERKVKLTKDTERKIAAAKDKQAAATPTATGTPAASATPTTTSTPTTEAKDGDTTALPTDTLGTAQPGSGSYTPPAPTPTLDRPGALLRAAGPDAGARRDPVGHAGAERDPVRSAGPDPHPAAGQHPGADPVGDHHPGRHARVDAVRRRRPARR